MRELGNVSRDPLRASSSGHARATNQNIERTLYRRPACMGDGER
jgi:hypothetical protein